LFKNTFTITVPLLLIMNTAVVIWIILWQARSVHALDKPYILFLRRFSSFSDRFLLNALLASHPKNCRMAFLTPVDESLLNLSPWVVAFSGASFRHPIFGSPLSLRARSIEWEDRIEDLIRAAACVVIDPSFPSPGIDREVEIVLATKSPENVLWLMDENAASQQLPSGVDPLQVVRYRQSWLTAAPRIILQLLALTFAGLFIAISLESSLRASTSLSSWIAWGIFAFSFALWTPVILRPSMRHSDKKYIKKSLGEKVIDVTARPTECSAIPLELIPRLCAILYPSTAYNEKKKRLLTRIACDMKMKPVIMSPFDSGDKAWRDAIRVISAADLLVADVSTSNEDVQYLIGVAHGLGIKTLLVSDRNKHLIGNLKVHQLRPDSDEDLVELSNAFRDLLRKPQSSGPVARLLADRLVFGESLPWRRLLAFFLDLALCVGMITAYQAWHGWPIFQKELWGMYFSMVTVVVITVYRFVFLAFTGTTPGMRITSLKLVSTDGGPPGLTQALGRSTAFLLQFFYLVSYLFILYRPRHQSLEDVLSKTQVVRR
jgi:uncharacterized RDD family membrane protein YckC